jgi:hypothetical protein
VHDARVIATFRTRGIRYVMAVALCLLLVASLRVALNSESSATNRVYGSVMAVVGAALLARSWSRGSASFGDSMLTVPGFVRTRRWPVDRLREVRLEAGRVGVHVRRYLVVVPLTGGEVAFKMVNERASACALERFAATVNGTIRSLD